MDEDRPPEPKLPGPYAPPGSGPPGALARLASARRRSGGERATLRWSTPVEDVVRTVVSDQAVAFWFEPRGLFTGRNRAHFLLLPLREVAVPGLDPDPLPGVGAESWLVWQSVTRTGYPARLPTDAGRLADRLGISGARGAAFVEEGLAELMAAIYESRAT